MSPEQLMLRSQQLRTKVGKAFLCERAVLRGKDIHNDLGDWEWFKVHLFAITGRELTENQLKFLSFMWVATAYPDPSIWPNHVAALGGTTRTTSSLAQMAGMAISEATLYGRRPERKALDFFYRMREKRKLESSIESLVELELQQNKVIYGYGRPLAKLDERIPHTLQKIRELELDDGDHYKFALEVYHYLKKKKGLSINIAALNTAVVADIGLTAEEYQLLLTPCFITGMIPCYIQARDEPEGSFFPVPCNAVDYSGDAERAW